MSSDPSHTSNHLYRDAVLCALVPVICLLPFITRAFHIDDPLFLWTAQQIHAHPFDFYGFDVNWDGFIKPMAQETKNPPLAAYYLALAAAVLGWSEVALHGAFLIPAGALGLGLFFLARRFCAHPVAATLAAVWTPAVLVSGSSVMSDVPMLALYVWALVAWFRGFEEDGHTVWLFVASLLIAAAALTKYFGLSLVPLLLVYAIVRLRRPGWWICALILPLLLTGLYEYVARRWYGTGGLLNAMGYVESSQTARPWALSTLTALTFTGGCIASVGWFLPFLRLRGLVPSMALLVAGCMAAAVFLPSVSGLFAQVSRGMHVLAFVEMGVLAAVGFSVFLLAAADVARHRDASSLFLCLWIYGTFVFAAYFNWSVTARTILPMAPPAGIVIVRRIETLRASGALVPRWAIAGPLVLSLLLGLWIAWTDAALANSARDAARRYGEEARRYSGQMYFQGHWGFQYYMEAEGVRPVAYRETRFAAGDAIICPRNNTNVWPVPEPLVSATFPGQFQGPRFVTTMSRPLGAGFYSDLWGPLPFALGPVPPERYYTLVLTGGGSPFQNVPSTE